MGKRDAKTDYTGFMPIVLMVSGWCAVMMIINTLIIISNPENVRITSVVRSGVYVEGDQGTASGGAPFPFGNRSKNPAYLDVYRDRIIVYPGAAVVPVRDLEIPGNAFEALLERVAKNSEDEYIVLLVRPRAALIARRLKKAIADRKIDIGYELFEERRPVGYEEAFVETRAREE